MKKIACLALTLVLLFAVSSCGLKKADVIDVVADSEPTKIVTFVEYVSHGDTLQTSFTTLIDKTNQRAQLDYAKERYATLEELSPTRKIVENGSVYYDMKTHLITADGGKTWNTADMSTGLGAGLDISRRNFKDYELSPNGNTITATIKASKVEDALGITIDLKEGEDVGIVIETDGEFIGKLTISWTTTSDAKVVATTTYSYAPVTVEALAPVTQ